MTTETKAVRPGSLRALAIEVMKENSDKPMAEVVVLIEKRLDRTNCKGYYVWAVENGHAPGKIEKPVRAPKVAQPKKKSPVDVKGKPAKEYMPGKFAEEKNPGVEDFDPDEARHEIDALMSNVNLGRNVPHFLQD